MGLNYLYLTKAVVNSTGATVYQFDFDIEKVSTALGLKVTQLESADTNYPYYYLIHAGEDTQNGVLIRVKRTRMLFLGIYIQMGLMIHQDFIFRLQAFQQHSNAYFIIRKIQIVLYSDSQKRMRSQE